MHLSWALTVPLLLPDSEKFPMAVWSPYYTFVVWSLIPARATGLDLRREATFHHPYCISYKPCWVLDPSCGCGSSIDCAQLVSAPKSLYHSWACLGLREPKQVCPATFAQESPSLMIRFTWAQYLLCSLEDPYIRNCNKNLEKCYQVDLFLSFHKL